MSLILLLNIFKKLFKNINYIYLNYIIFIYKYKIKFRTFEHILF